MNPNRALLRTGMLTNNVRIGRQNRSKLRKVIAKLKIEAEDEDEQLAAKPD